MKFLKVINKAVMAISLLLLFNISVNASTKNHQWIYDKNSNCGIYYNMGTEKGLQVFWSGACRDKKAQGYGIAIISSENNGTRSNLLRFEGNIENGKFNGQAYLSWYKTRDKGSFNFVNGVLEGEANIMTNNREVFLSGNYNNGKFTVKKKAVMSTNREEEYYAFKKTRKSAYKYQTLLREKLTKQCEYREHELRARKYDGRRLSALAFRALITCYSENEKYVEALNLYNEALKYPKADNKIFVKRLHHPLAFAYHGVGKYEKSFRHLENMDNNSITKEALVLLESKHFMLFDSKRKRLLKKFGNLVNNKMFKAIKKSDIESLMEALKAGANVNLRNKKGEIPLIEAGYYNNVKIITALLDAGAKINAQSNDGSTALMNASYKGHNDIVKLLLLEGANPNLKTKKGSTALTFSIKQDHRKSFKELLTKANVQTKTDALSTASCMGEIAIMKVLLKNGAINSKRQETDLFENNPFTKAFLCEKEESLRILSDDFSRKENYTNMLAAKLAYNHKYMDAIKVIEKEAQNNPKYLTSLVIPLSLEKYFIDGKITNKDIPFLSSKFEFPKPINVNSVKIYAPDSTWGSGFYITDDILMTNHHVVVDRQQKKHKILYILDRFMFDNKYIKMNLSNYKKAKIIALDEPNDLALLKLLSPNENAPIIQIDSGYRFENTTLYAAGFPSFSNEKKGYIPKQTISRGLHKISISPDPSVSNDYSKLHASIPSNHGGSGGPIINSCNQLVSVLRGGAEAANYKNNIDYLLKIPTMMGASHVNIIKFLKKNHIFTSKSKPCLPFGVPHLDSMQALVAGVRFYNADQVSGLMLSESKVLFIAPKNIKAGDTIIAGYGDVFDKVGTVINIDKKTRLALFEITDKNNKEYFSSKNFFTMSRRVRNNYTGFNKVIFSEEKYTKNKPSYYVTTVYGGSTKKERTLIKGGGYFTRNGKKFEQRENYSLSNVFTIAGTTLNWLNGDKDKVYIDPEIDASSLGAVVLDECGYIQGMVQYDSQKNNSIVDSREIITLLEKWGVSTKIDKCK